MTHKVVAESVSLSSSPRDHHDLSDLLFATTSTLAHQIQDAVAGSRAVSGLHSLRLMEWTSLEIIQSIDRFLKVFLHVMP